MKRLFLVFICSVFGFWSVLPAAPKPAQKLANMVEGALEAVYGDCCIENSLEEKQTRVRELLESNYDMTILIRRAIGRNWNLMSADEQVQVLELVKQLVIKAYVRGLNGKGRPVISFDETIEVSAKRIEIPSVVVLDGEPIRVLYRMGMAGGDWQLFDIVAEDISVVSNYRQQFDDHFRKGNGAALVKRLEELLQKDDLDETIEL